MAYGGGAVLGQSTLDPNFKGSNPAATATSRKHRNQLRRPHWFYFVGERDINRRKPKNCLGQVFNFKLGSLTDNTINPLNANGRFYSWKLGPGFVLLAEVCLWLCLIQTLQGWVCWTYKSDLGRTTKCDSIHNKDCYVLGSHPKLELRMSFCSTNWLQPSPVANLLKTFLVPIHFLFL